MIVICSTPCVEIPPRFTDLVPPHVVVTASLTFSTLAITLLIKVYTFEISKVAIFGSFSFRMMLKMMQRAVKKMRKMRDKIIHCRVKVEYNTLEPTCVSFEAFKGLLQALLLMHCMLAFQKYVTNFISYPVNLKDK